MRACWYHGNCWDGFGAAYALWRQYGDSQTTYRAVNYGEGPPKVESGVQDLWLLDFTYPRDVLDRLVTEVDRLFIIDHHKTAAQALEDFECHVKIFDMEHSGAYLTYRYLNPEAAPENVPLLYDYLQDRDLWRFELPQSREINAYIRTQPYDFSAWSQMEVTIELAFERAVNEGAASLRLVDRTVEMICAQAYLKTIGDYAVPTVNATAFWSEVGHLLLQQWPQARVVCSYFDKADGMRVYSLRSRPDFDCSELARRFGGGGHKTASGFALPIGASTE